MTSSRRSEGFRDGLGQELLSTLREATGDDQLCFEVEPRPLTGGFYAQMLRFRLADSPAGLAGDLVARIVPDRDVGAWEAAFQSYVARQGFPTPVIRLTADESSPLGRFLIVMDHVEGRPPIPGLDFTTVIARLPSLVRRLPEELAGMAAQLHALDPEPLVRELQALDGGVPLTGTQFVERQTARAALLGTDELVRAGDRLLSTQPTSGPVVVTHGDLHPFNLLETRDGPVLVDWTVAAVAHPGFTLAFTELMLANPPIALPRAGAAVLGRLGRRMARRFLDRYESLTAHREGSVDATTLAWYRRVHALRILVEIAGWDANGERPRGHPWLLLEPVARRELEFA